MNFHVKNIISNEFNRQNIISNEFSRQNIISNGIPFPMTFQVKCQKYVINSILVSAVEKIISLEEKLYLTVTILLPDFYQLASVGDQNHHFFYITS